MPDATQDHQFTDADKVANKSLYRLGDATRSGNKIAAVYFSLPNVIFFRSEAGTLCWEVDNLNPVHGEAFQTFKQLAVEAESTLTKPRWLAAQKVLVAALSRAFSSETAPDCELCFKPVRDFIDKHRAEVTTVIATGPQFVVYRGSSGTVSWNHEKLPDHLTPAIDEFERLNSLVNAVMPAPHRKAAGEMLGSALGAALRKGEGTDPLAPFEGARDFIVSQTIASVRARMFVASVAATASLLVALFWLAAYASIDTKYLSAIGSGALGAMVSSLQRNSGAALNPYGSRLALYSDIFSRLVIGAVFGLIVVLAAQGDIALSAFRTNDFAMLLFSFVAGFSERFVPDLLSSTSGQVKVSDA